MPSLDEILATREPAPAQEQPQEQTTQAPAETTGTEEQTTEQTTGADGGVSGQGSTAVDGKPPIGAIRQAEREKADKRYTAVLDGLRQEIAARDAAWEQRVAKMLEAQRPRPEPKPVPDIFENADGFVDHKIAGPISEVRGVLLHQSRYLAEMRHTEEAVNAADAAFSEAHATGKLDPADLQRVLNSPNIYDAAVKWHKRQQAQAEIGDDPAAFKERVKAELLAELKAQNGGEQQQDQQEQPARVMPSNLTTARNVGSRTGPAWTGPAPLEDIFSRKR